MNIELPTNKRVIPTFVLTSLMTLTVCVDDTIDPSAKAIARPEMGMATRATWVSPTSRLAAK